MATVLESLPQRRIARFGWKPDLPDQRDLELDLAPLKPVPAGLRKFSLRDQEPEPAFDQGQLGSCTGNGVAFVVQFERAKQGLQVFRPSRLAIYYGERVIEGSVDQDAGAMIRDGIKVVARTGAGPEDLWPYDIQKFAQQPPQPYFDAAATDQVLQYARCAKSVTAIKQAIYNGFPVVKGFTVYDSFEGDQNTYTGIMPMPNRAESVLGGHCTVWTGWDDDLSDPTWPAHGAFENRNSWGTGWGDHGHYWEPYRFAVSRNTSDLWTIRTIEPAQA